MRSLLHKLIARPARRGVAAVEFALVCIPFLLFLMAVVSVAYNFYVQQALDYATQDVAREVEIGAIPATYTASDFINQGFCPIFTLLQSCTGITVDLHPVSDYYQLTQAGANDGPGSINTGAFSFCTGQPGQLMYLHIVYMATNLAGLLSPGSGATTPMVANAAFANQNPAGKTVAPTNGC